MTATQVWRRQTGNLTESGRSVAGSAGAALSASLTNPGPQSSPHGSAISTLTIAAAGHGPALAYSASGLPAGLSISGSTGAITGTPGTAGVYPVTVTITDASTGVAESVHFDWSIT